MTILGRIKQATKTNILKITRNFVRPSFPQLETEEINLNLGCGFINHPSFINIDCLPLPHVHYIRSIDNLSPFATESVDLIYASHSLEHFPHSQTKQVLTEWFRVLKKGGVLRLSVPDFDLLVKIYEQNSYDVELILHPLMGSQNYRYNFHMTAFNSKYLSKLLKSVGFQLVQPWEPGISEETTFNDFSVGKLPVNEKEYPVSLNLEAIK